METTNPTPPTCPATVSVRRNPHRKARPTPLTNPLPLSLRPSPYSQISSFPIQDILSEEIPPKPNVSAASETPKDSTSENLRVYLRVRPLVPLKGSTKNVGDQNQKSRVKNVWPQNPSKIKSEKEKKTVKKKSNESCITVSDDFHSVVLSPPLSLQETKRIKSEVYEGFSYVFPAESTQSEVYEKMVNPLVEDFLNGKSGMLAAVGPTGSGKTHTVFGSPREPGMVPRALQRIFKCYQGHSSQSSRQFYLSVFEICAERGKAERICDLTSDGPDLYMQQSTIRGLQEVLVQDNVEAEQLIARALLRRSTAMTNANSQSSRSQCIINIRRGADKSDADSDEQSDSAVLSIVDLAGAEREKRTGNQGARLTESNFINNTSMVFGLCLRSLLEHQKNPKKALQQHFKNSLLTRYLRDYMEGRKRMALLLAVKPGEDDYLDASYLLRQASPYMKIKFTNALCNKRNQTTSRPEQSKRMKIVNPDASVIEGKIVGDENQLPSEEDSICNEDLKNSRLLKLNYDGLKERERNHQIMQNFAKALWSVLKQQNEKLKVAENENKILRENLRNEKNRCIEMEKELNDLRTYCFFSREKSVASSVPKENENFECTVHLEGHTPENDNPLQRQQQNIYSEVPSPITCELDSTDDKQEPEAMVRRSVADVDSLSISVPNDNCQSCQIHESSPGKSNYAVAEHLNPNSDVTDAVSTSGNDSSASVQPGEQLLRENNEDSLDRIVSPKEAARTQQPDPVDAVCTSGDDSTVSVQLGEQLLRENNEDSLDQIVSPKEVEHTQQPHPVDAVCSSGNDSSVSVKKLLPENNEDSLDQIVSPKEVEHTQQPHPVDVPKIETRPNASSSSTKKEKPRRQVGRIFKICKLLGFLLLDVLPLGS
ncbi:hypothetical protein CCACVL1_09079 [Corchorus capsularis]|uniref:Kinesin motor domain-containing protein n=1 Tax=Corchorus capsularis TaxID=210143 RepID=A0A1R3IXV8_COCAP|nr:hypothetical protein CCACVL1_09079 [Corchorus capsularis]